MYRRVLALPWVSNLMAAHPALLVPQVLIPLKLLAKMLEEACLVAYALSDKIIAKRWEDNGTPASWVHQRVVWQEEAIKQDANLHKSLVMQLVGVVRGILQIANVKLNQFKQNARQPEDLGMYHHAILMKTLAHLQAVLG